ncbi:hypothetical protein TraAM80_01424 [Trypanosoma rangeli]|uniref:Uncharacterized protein n=1 Tax=Trypanosoma rangeli TaxID=5698 RepID=A0A3R7KVL3_TRYRA|nr:uncharacterized protein TraAM80_01424 [Trypanosoma rangeli]RNF10608.1 hypothetical protein TraAM80_01424 [Trypanosoma rangeli]|eukprot:RNF10608.1 hypothetical protein TraAM80_01424 [Trypanosoma rangeli]
MLLDDVPFSALPHAAEETQKLGAAQKETLTRLTALRGDLEELVQRSAALYAECEHLAPQRVIKAVGSELARLQARIENCQRRANTLGKKGGANSSRYQTKDEFP